MRKKMDYLNKYENFLSQVDLDYYRGKYKNIKIVELDMPKNVQALAAIYEEYWNKRSGEYAMFEEFYENLYLPSLESDLEKFRELAGFSKETFYRGLPARIYRTWASLLTQIQGAYVAETIYGIGKVNMSVSNDHRGRDLVIDVDNVGRLGIQIKKETNRRDALRLGPKEKEGVRLVDVEYAVPPSDPYKKNGEKRKPYIDWEEKWGTRLKRLPNGFIVFREEMFSLRKLINYIE